MNIIYMQSLSVASKRAQTHHVAASTKMKTQFAHTFHSTTYGKTAAAT